MAYWLQGESSVQYLIFRIKKYTFKNGDTSAKALTHGLTLGCLSLIWYSSRRKQFKKNSTCETQKHE